VTPGHRGLSAVQLRKGKNFFFEKKPQKTFAPPRACAAQAVAHDIQKVFFAACLFTKKPTFPPLISVVAG
jgi:hypothetical protein